MWLTLRPGVYLTLRGKVKALIDRDWFQRLQWQKIYFSLTLSYLDKLQHAQQRHLVVSVRSEMSGKQYGYVSS